MREKSPNDEDAERIAEMIEEKYTPESKEEFFDAYDDYMIDTEIVTPYAKEKTWKAYFKTKKIKHSRKKALARRTIESRRIKKRYTKEFLQKRQAKRVKTKREFKYLAKVKGRTVYARKVKQKNGVRYKDIKGHYVSLYNPKKVSGKKHKTKSSVHTRQKR